jgi:hypothetical protein
LVEPYKPHDFRRRKIKRRLVSRSFRIRPEIDRMLDKEADKKGWSKTFLIQDIIVSWANYNKRRLAVEVALGMDASPVETERE